MTVLDHVGALRGSSNEPASFGEEPSCYHKLMAFVAVQYFHLFAVDDVGCALSTSNSNVFSLSRSQTGLVFADFQGDDLATFGFPGKECLFPREIMAKDQFWEVFHVVGLKTSLTNELLCRLQHAPAWVELINIDFSHMASRCVVADNHLFHVC